MDNKQQNKTFKLPNQLRQMRINSGLTQQEVADKIGISLRQWQRYEKEGSLATAPFQIVLKAGKLFEKDVYDFVNSLKDIYVDRLCTPDELYKKGEKTMKTYYSFKYGTLKILLPKTSDDELNKEIESGIEQLKSGKYSYVALMMFLLDNKVPVTSFPLDFTDPVSVDQSKRFNEVYKKRDLLYEI